MSETTHNTLRNLVETSKQEKLKARGTRQEVFAGLAKRTGGGLTKDDLKENSKKQVVSKRASDICEAIEYA